MNNYKLNFIHLCDDAIFSQDGKLSLIGIFEVVNIAALPGSLLKAFLVFNLSALNKKIEEVEINLTIRKSDDGKDILKLPALKTNYEIKEKNVESKLGVILQLANITFEEIGKYTIEIEANKESIASLPFEVKLQKERG